MPEKVIAFANQKGGVGKTTSSVNVSASLAARGLKVLLLDLDPQGNATMGSGIDKQGVTFSMNDLLQQAAPIEEVIIPNTPGGYDLISSNADLTEAEVKLLQKTGNERILKSALDEVTSQYDFIIIDCPPSLNMLTVNGLVAADGVVITMQCEYFALEGLSELLNTMQQIQGTLNPDLHLFGILRTLFDGRNKLSVEVSQQLINHFGNRVFQSIIPRNVRLAEAPSYGLPVLLYDRHSKGAAAYDSLAHEFIRRAKHNMPTYASATDESVNETETV